MSQETGEQILQKSIEAHGGWEAFEDLTKVHFDKTTQLYHADGSLEAVREQRQEFQLLPTYFVRIAEQKRGKQHTIFYDRINAEVFEDSIEIRSVAEIDAAKQLGRSAEYVFFQPFQLYKSEARFTYLGNTKLFDSIPVKEVRVEYPGQGASDDQWTYFFDDTYKCRAALVKHEGKRSLIVTTQFQSYKNVLFHKYRKSYFVDSLLQKEYLRADYVYEILQN